MILPINLFKGPDQQHLGKHLNYYFTYFVSVEVMYIYLPST